MDLMLKDEVAADFDIVGGYDQNAVNGFTGELLDSLMRALDLAEADQLLDLMAGDGNLTDYMLQYCRREKIRPPAITISDVSGVQCDIAEQRFSDDSVEVIAADVLDLFVGEGAILAEGQFDRVVVKSANHEIPRDKQLRLYQNVFRALKPGGVFVNMGFLFDDPAERDEFRELCRCKDEMAGLHHAVSNRYLCMRNEFYSFLERAGFVDLECFERFDYSINTEIGVHHYFSDPEQLREANLVIQATQARSMSMRRHGRIHFWGEHSVMCPPGEITIAKKPNWQESNRLSFVHCAYDFLRNIECYDELRNEIGAHISPGARVLDLGCGPGLLAEKIKDRVSSYKGIDFSQEFIADAKDRFREDPHVQFDQGDLMDIVIDEHSVDAVVLSNVLYLPGIQPQEVLEKAIGALSDDGVIIVSGPTSSDSFQLAMPHMEAQLRGDGFLDTEEGMSAFKTVCEANARLLPGAGNYWSIEGMIELLRALGCSGDIKSSTEIYYGYGFLVSVVK